MVFSSVIFLFLFLPLVLLAYLVSPKPLRNLAAERPALQRELYEALDPILGSDREVRPAPRLTPEEEAQLRGLGYL